MYDRVILHYLFKLAVSIFFIIYIFFLLLQETESLVSKDPIDKEKLVVKIKKEKPDDVEKKKKKRKKIEDGTGDASKPKKMKDPNKVKIKVKIKKEPSKDKLPVIKQEDIEELGKVLEILELLLAYP